MLAWRILFTSTLPVLLLILIQAMALHGDARRWKDIDEHFKGFVSLAAW